MPKILGMSSGAKNEANMAKHKVIIFAPIIAVPTLTAVSLQLNGMLMMWKIQQAKQDDVIWDTLLPCCFLSGNRGEVFIRQNFPARLPRSRLEKPRSQEWSQRALSYEHIGNFTKDLDQAHVKRPLDRKLTSFCLNTNYPAYSDLLAFTGELLIMKRWLPLLRD